MNKYEEPLFANIMSFGISPDTIWSILSLQIYRKPFNSAID